MGSERLIDRCTQDITIANGASLSAEVNLAGYILEAITMPATWTAANLTFAAATASGGTFNQVNDDGGTEVTITAAASRCLLVPPTKLSKAIQFLKVRSGTAGVAVAQGGARTLTLHLRRGD